MDVVGTLSWGKQAEARLVVGAMLGALCVVACTGQLGDGDGASPSGDGDAAVVGDGDGGELSEQKCEEVGIDVAPTVLRRLSNLEFSLTLTDLFALEEEFDTATFPQDTFKGGFSAHADIQSVSAQHLRAYWEAAELLGADLLGDTARAATVIGCELADETCLSEFVARFGRIAFRRPLTEEEAQGLVQGAKEVALDENDAYRFVIEAVLLSPHFLYRVEVGDTPEGLSKLDAYEVASKMAFTLWGRAPSSELLDAAAAGQLDTDAGLRAVAEEHLRDERTQQYYAAFFRQWLGYAQLGAPKDRPADWDDALIDDLRAETDQVMAQFAFGNANLLDALTTNTTYLTPALAGYYGLPTDGTLSPFEFAEDHPRAHTGVLSHGSLLVQSRDGDLISMRGNWLRHTFLCEHLEIPAAIAEELGDRLEGLTRTQIVEERNSEAGCRGCHNLIDPVGIGFLPFDGSGRYDETIDPTVFGIEPALVGVDNPEFDSIAELAQMLAEHPQVAGCLAERAYLFTQGREPQEADACAVSGAAQGFAASNHDFVTLLETLVAHPSFRLRRAPVPTL